jgi:membrane-associated phospholipid phosphatase
VINQRRLWIWILGIVIGLGLVYAAFQADGPVQQWQHDHRLRHHQELSRVITRLTDWPLHLVAGLALAGLAWWRGRKRWVAIFLSMVVALALAGTAAYCLKVAVGRPRPAVKIERIWHQGDFRPNHHAFPSGHTAASAGFFGVLLFVCWRLGVALFLIPVLVGASRIFLGAHYLSDVVGGLVLGTVAAGLVGAFVRRITRREAAELSG